ncbi:hypothetical protein [Tessaracoccus sp.]
MVRMQLTAQLKVQGGPTLALNSTLNPESYVFASVVLDAAGGTDAQQDVPLLPDAGTVVLLAVNAHLANGLPAQIALTPRNGPTTGPELTIDGTFVVAHAGALGALVTDGPRLVTVTNSGAAAVTVDVLAALEPA